MDSAHVLLERIKKNSRQKIDYLDKAFGQLQNNERNILNKYIDYCLSCGLTIDYLAESYNRIVYDTLREQIYFKRYNRYRYSSYNEVASSVYSNDSYMKMYMYGLSITRFLWPQHAAMGRFFLETIPHTKKGSYLEIGPGHGFYFMQAMNSCSFDTYEGVDISPSSIAMTTSILKSNFFGNFHNYRLIEGDFLKIDFKHEYDALIMGEVLEHAEQPEHFLKKILFLASRNAYIYISTCVNAPAVDHIFLFQSVQHLEAMVRSAGLTVIKNLVLPYFKLTLQEAQRKKLPINVAMILGKNE